MSALDFTTIFARDFYMRPGSPPDDIALEEASEAMALRIAELCPDCDDEGDRPTGQIDRQGNPYIEPCTHQAAPTIAKLLAIGAAVIAVESSADGWIVQLPGHPATNTAQLLLAQLRSVQP